MTSNAENNVSNWKNNHTG